MNVIINEKGKFLSTADLCLATTLSLWHNIDSIDRSDPARASFLFVEDETLQHLANKYWKGALKVEPQMFFAQLKVVKNRLYNGDKSC